MINHKKQIPSLELSDCPGLFGINPNEVVGAIKKRAHQWRNGSREPDGCRIGLVIEGGGMRGVCSGGGAVALAHMGFCELFDEVYATSAGVMNASYFLSSQPDLGIAIYYDCLASRQFVDPLRFWKIVDIDYVFDHVVTVAKPLDVNRVLASRSRLLVAVIDWQTGEGRIIDTRKTSTPLLQVLKAATAMPVLYNRTVNVDGRPCLDGGSSIPFPIEQALVSGCTHLLVLLTRPHHYVCPRPNWPERWIFNLLCGRTNDRLRHNYSIYHERERSCRDLALGRGGLLRNVNVATICTDDEETIHRTSTDRVALRAAAVRYGRSTIRAFGGDAESWDLSPLTIL